MSDTPTLKPCPLCGSSKVWPKTGGAGNWFIECGECGLTTDDRGHERTITAWNTRNDAQVAALAEALKALIPKNVGDNQSLPDDFNLPCDISMGEVRQARRALAAFGGQQ